MIVSVQFYAVDKNTTVFKSKSAQVKSARHFVVAQSVCPLVHFIICVDDSSYWYSVLLSEVRYSYAVMFMHMLTPFSFVDISSHVTFQFLINRK